MIFYFSLTFNRFIREIRCRIFKGCEQKLTIKGKEKNSVNEITICIFVILTGIATQKAIILARAQNRHKVFEPVLFPSLEYVKSHLSQINLIS